VPRIISQARQVVIGTLTGDFHPLDQIDLSTTDVSEAVDKV